MTTRRTAQGMDRFIHGIIRHRKAVVAVFLAAAVVCAAFIPFVKTNYNMVDYLPDEAQSTTAVEIMEQEFSQAVPNANVLVHDVTVPQALAFKDKIAAVDGVEGVMWLDDVMDVAEPLETADQETVETYYRVNDPASSGTDREAPSATAGAEAAGTALFQVTVAEGEEGTAIPALRGLVDQASADNAAAGGRGLANAVSGEAMDTAQLPGEHGAGGAGRRGHHRARHPASAGALHALVDRAGAVHRGHRRVHRAQHGHQHRAGRSVVHHVFGEPHPAAGSVARLRHLPAPCVRGRAAAHGRRGAGHGLRDAPLAIHHRRKRHHHAVRLRGAGVHAVPDRGRPRHQSGQGHRVQLRDRHGVPPGAHASGLPSHRQDGAPAPHAFVQERGQGALEGARPGARAGACPGGAGLPGPGPHRVHLPEQLPRPQPALRRRHAHGAGRVRSSEPAGGAGAARRRRRRGRACRRSGEGRQRQRRPVVRPPPWVPAIPSGFSGCQRDRSVLLGKLRAHHRLHQHRRGKRRGVRHRPGRAGRGGTSASGRSTRPASPRTCTT